jgi:Rrf2 family protein
VRLNMRTQYALRALIGIAMNSGDESVKVRELAWRENIPVKFLEQVMVILKNAGFVLSRRGRNGGYVLARPSCDIMLGDLIRQMEGSGSAVANLKDSTMPTGLREVMEEVDQATNYLLDSFSLAEICRRSRQSHPQHKRNVVCV